MSRGWVLPGGLMPGDRLPDHNLACTGPAVLAVGEVAEHPAWGRVVPVLFDGDDAYRLFPSGADIYVERPDNDGVPA